MSTTGAVHYAYSGVSLTGISVLFFAQACALFQKINENNLRMSSLARFAAHEITSGDTAALQSACDVGLSLSGKHVFGTPVRTV